ncbi:MAG TPA: hypothetical protein P5560_12660 [Thermotogota bacterium]|nr:hypothetical protein [Thermotogota bacterium]HRW93795.1 hypothetical protein [Thermotogota bacterium]
MARKKSKKGRNIFLVVLILAVLGILALIYGYIDFEFKKLGESGVTPLSDWRSYLAFLMSKVPVIKNYVEYTPRAVIQPQKYYTEIYEAYVEKIEADRAYLEKRNSDLNAYEQQLVAYDSQLKSRGNELDLREERLESEWRSWTDQKARFEELGSWFANADEELIAPALASDEVSVDELVGGLRLIDPGIAADIVGQLAQVNADKAALVIARLAGKEVIE